MSQYILKKVETRQELDKVVEVLWIAHYNPYRPLFQIHFPVFTPSENGRRLAMEHSKDQLWESHCSSEYSHWLYVKDIYSQEIVGATQWEIQCGSTLRSDFATMGTTAWPSGEARDFCTKALQQVYAARRQFLQGPYIVANLMSVLPRHRGKGIGSLLMSWVIGKARELDYQCWVEATETGKRLYKKFGYRVVVKIACDMSNDKSGDEWHRLEHDLTPDPYYAMWRPAESTLSTGEMSLSKKRKYADGSGGSDNTGAASLID